MNDEDEGGGEKIKKREEDRNKKDSTKGKRRKKTNVSLLEDQIDGDIDTQKLDKSSRRKSSDEKKERSRRRNSSSGQASENTKTKHRNLSNGRQSKTEVIRETSSRRNLSNERSGEREGTESYKKRDSLGRRANSSDVSRIKTSRRNSSSDRSNLRHSSMENATMADSSIANSSRRRISTEYSEKRKSSKRRSSKSKELAETPIKKSTSSPTDRVQNPEISAASIRGQTTVVQNLANLVGSFSEIDTEEEPIRSSLEYSQENAEKRIELLRERDARKRETTRRMMDDALSKEDTPEYSPFTVSRESSRNSILASIDNYNKNPPGNLIHSNDVSGTQGYQNESRKSISSSNDDLSASSKVGAYATSGGSQMGKNRLSVIDAHESYNPNLQRPGAVAVNAPASRGKGRSMSPNDSRVGAVAVSSAAPRGKAGVSTASVSESYEARGGTMSTLMSQESYDPNLQRPGAVAVNAPASRGKGRSMSPNDSRVGAVAVSSAAPRGKAGVSTASVSESYEARGGTMSTLMSQESYDPNLQRPGAVAVNAPASRGKGRSMSPNDSRVGAIAVSSAAPRGKAGVSTASVSESYKKRGGGVSSAPVPQSKDELSVSSRRESYDLENKMYPVGGNDFLFSAGSRVGAVAVSGSAPKGKGRLSTSSSREDYGQQSITSTGVGAFPAAGAAPKGKPAPLAPSAHKTYEPSNRVGAVSMRGAAPQGKRSTTVGATHVAAPANRGKGEIALSSGAETYSDDGMETRVSGRRFSADSMSSRDSLSQVGAISVNGNPSISKDGKGSRISIRQGAEHYDGDESPRTGARGSTRNDTVKSENYGMSGNAQHGKTRRSSLDSSCLSESASHKDRVSHFPTSDLYSSISSLQETSSDTKGRISQFPGEENYEEDLDQRVTSRANRRSSDLSGKSGFDSGPSYYRTDESYDGDPPLQREGSLRSGMSSGSRSDSIQRRPGGSAGAYFISGNHVEEREPVSLGYHDQDDILEAVVTLQGSNAISSESIAGKPWFRSRICVIVLLCCIAIFGTIAAVLPLVVFKKDSNGPPLTPIIQIDIQRQKIIQEVVQNITSIEMLNDPLSSQNSALHWIIVTDTLSPVTLNSVSEVEREKVMTRYALAAFYYATNGTRWIKQLDWLNGQADECSWQFITCSDPEHKVITFDTGTAGNNLLGGIPSEIKALHSLVELKLPSNRLSDVSLDISSLKNLGALDISKNDFQGPFPEFLLTLTSLTLLDLHMNKFSGTISSKISRLINLSQLMLNDNNFYGTMTSELSGLNGLRLLDLSVNGLAGNFQTVISDLDKLIILRLFRNKFTGTLDSSIERMTELSEFAVYENSLSGTIPESLGNLNSLNYLDLVSNRIFGTIPTSLAQLTSLVYVYLEENQITGTVPSALCETASLLAISADCDVQCPCQSCEQQGCEN